MQEPINIDAQLREDHRGLRLDQALAQVFPQFSRARIQAWIRSGELTVNRAPCRPRDRVRGGEQVQLRASLAPAEVCVAEALPLDIVFEDEAILVVNKAVNMVVHVAAGNWQGTLQNALLHHVPALAQLPRAGIVHRLDKDTTGLLVVAKTLTAHKYLVEQLQRRAFERHYAAIVRGVMTAGGTVNEAIGRHPVDRKRMAVVANGKPAVTHYRVERRFRAHTLISVRLETGRTHQIRVHMAHKRYPIVGDPLYGGRTRLASGCSEALSQALQAMPRQALHAQRLGLTHPLRQQAMTWEAPLPMDMQHLLRLLDADDRFYQLEADPRSR